MKVLNWLGWISGCIGILIILFAAISLVMGRNLFGFTHIINYFHAANSFFLITIAIFIVTYSCQCKKD